MNDIHKAYREDLEIAINHLIAKSPRKRANGAKLVVSAFFRLSSPDRTWARKTLTQLMSNPETAFLEVQNAQQALNLLYGTEHLPVEDLNKPEVRRQTSCRSETKVERSLKRSRARDAKYCLRDPGLRRDLGGKFVVVHDCKVWGHGDKLSEAILDAQRKSNCPPMEELVIAVVPLYHNQSYPFGGMSPR